MTELEQLIQYWKDYPTPHNAEVYKTQIVPKAKATIKYLEELKRKIEDEEIPLKGIPIIY